MKKAIRFMQDIGIVAVGIGFFGAVGNLDRDLAAWPALIWMLVGILAAIFTDILDRMIYREKTPDGPLIDIEKQKLLT